MSANYADKIAALLAKAERTTNAAERDAYTEKAERLMVEWGISDALLDEARSREKGRQCVKIVERGYYIEGQSAALLAELVAACIARGVGPIRTLIVRGRPVWYAVGYEDDLDRTEKYVPHLVEQARDAWKVYRDSVDWWTGTERDRARRAFLDAFGWTVYYRLRRLFYEAAEESPGSGAELVMVGRQDAVNAEVDGRGIRAARPRKTTDWDAAAEGRHAGYAASISAGSVES